MGMNVCMDFVLERNWARSVAGEPDEHEGLAELPWYWIPYPSHLENLRQDGAREERRMLDDDIVAFILKGDADFLQEKVGRFADNHGGHELTANPWRRTCGSAGGIGVGAGRVRGGENVQAPPPGATAASRTVMRSSGRCLARWYAADRPAEPAPTARCERGRSAARRRSGRSGERSPMTTSEMAVSYQSLP